MPVRQAFQKLRSEGLLIMAKGKRPIIGSGRVPWDFQQLRGFSEEMRRRGLVPSAKVLALEIEEPDPETAQALKLAVDEKTYCLQRLRFVDKKPVAVVTSHLPVRLFSGIEKQDLAKQSLYHVFENVVQGLLRQILLLNSGKKANRQMTSDHRHRFLVHEAKALQAVCLFVHSEFECLRSLGIRLFDF